MSADLIVDGDTDGIEKMQFSISGKVVFELRRDGFLYNGELIEDAGKAYNLFIEFLTKSKIEEVNNE